jgi:hypothetical protein
MAAREKWERERMTNEAAARPTATIVLLRDGPDGLINFRDDRHGEQAAGEARAGQHIG